MLTSESALNSMKSEKVKCYIGNLDGDRLGLVVAANQREAARIASTGLVDFRRHWNARLSPWPIQAPKLRTLYTRWYDGGEWVEGRVRSTARISDGANVE
jgi:hypothetical protein